MVGFSFAPQGWAFCNGQLLPISSNSALFSLLGTQFGGDGRTTFALPDLRGRVPMHYGQGNGLSGRSMGQEGGAEQVTLTQQELPVHGHNTTLNLDVDANSSLKAVGGPGSAASSASGNAPADGNPIYKPGSPNVDMNAEAVTTTVDTNGSSVTVENAGGSQPHANMQPFTVINFVIALTGIYPARD